MLPATIDLLAFMGQSNMAGRGVAAQAPAVPEGHGYEFRAITAPDRLSPLVEPFGQHEDKPDGIYEPGMKTGSMVSSFVNAYYAEKITARDTSSYLLNLKAKNFGKLERWCF